MSAFMEPIHLEKDEIELELRLRGMSPVITRHRLDVLRERLLMEMRGEVEVPKGHPLSDYASEVVHCFEKLKEIDYIMLEAADKDCLKSIMTIPSRLIHIMSRLTRISTYDHRLLNQIKILKKKISDYLELIKLSIEKKIVLKEHFKSSDSIFKSVNKSDIFKKTSIVESATQRPLTPISNPLPLRPLGALPKVPAPIPEEVAVSDYLKDAEPRFDGGEELSVKVNAGNLDYGSDQESINSLNDDLLWDKLMDKVPSSSPKFSGLKINENIQSRLNTGMHRNVPERINVVEEGGAQSNWWNAPKRNDILRSSEPGKKLTGTFKKPTVVPQNYWNMRGTEFTAQERPQERPQVRRPERLPEHFREHLPEPPQMRYQVPPVYEEQDYPQQRDVRHTRHRNPILSWNLVFTGDGRGLNINNFLTQVHLMARADWVSDRDLFLSAIHLLSGPARNWYVAFERNYRTWVELAAALREQFLPHDSDISLMREVENKFQGMNEPFVLYISDMINLFDHMQVPISDDRKLKIITRNMLPYLRESLALVEIRDVNHLIVLCRKLESVRKGVVPNSSNVYTSRNQRVSEIEVEDRRFDQSRNFDMDQKKTNMNCWNCLDTGHIFENCPRPKMRVFCYVCGELGQLANNCRICKNSKNVQPRSDISNSNVRGGYRQ